MCVFALWLLEAVEYCGSMELMGEVCAQARYSMLEKLMADGDDAHNVVFMDPDIFVIGDLSELFSWNFDYAATISAGDGQPINGAMHFVRAKKYAPAVQILKDVLQGCVFLVLE